MSKPEIHARWKAKEQRRGVRRVQIPLKAETIDFLEKVSANKLGGRAQRLGAAVEDAIESWRALWKP